MPRKMDEDGVSKGKQRNPPSRIPPPKSGKFHAKGLENGFQRGDGGGVSGITKATGQSGANAANKDQRRLFETFVMTGDMIIQTTSPHHKPDAVQSSPKEKRSSEVKGSPVPAKKECKSNIAKIQEPRKTNNQRSQSALPSPKASPKKLQNPSAEPESPKQSPKNNRKSPGKQSRLPRLHTPKGSPKASPKVSPKRTHKTSEMSDQLPQAIECSTDVDSNTGSFVDEDNSAASDVINANTSTQNGNVHVKPASSPPHQQQQDMRPNELELLGYTRYPDMPVELDIPPDDICSEDECFKNECVLDVDDLPPPPEDFFEAELDVVRNLEPLPPAPFTFSMPSVMIPQEDGKRGQVLDSPIINGPGPNKLDDLPPSQLSPVRETQEISVAEATESEHDSELSVPPSDSESVIAAVGEQDSCSSTSSSKRDSLPMPSAGHTRCSSMDENSSSIELDNHSTCSDSKLEQPEYRNSPGRAMVVSKSAEKIAPGKVATTPSKGVPLSSVVRSSKSHENCLETNDRVTFVDIDIDENMASSVDALHYEQSTASLDSLGYVQFSPDQVRSLDNSPDRRSDKPSSDRMFMPTFINLEEPKSVTKARESGKLRSPAKHKDSSPSRSHSSPSKDSSGHEDKAKPSPSNSPGHPRPSAIPVSTRDGVRKPPRPPVRSASTQRSPTNPVSPQTVATSSSNPVSGSKVVSTVNSEPLPGDVVESQEPVRTVPPPVSPTVIESPVRGAQSHVVDTDLPRADDAPIATSSPPSSPVICSHDERGMAAKSDDSELSEEPGVYHQPQKESDRPSAQRLAKRLFHLDGFKKSDVTRHLCKKNDFSFLVGEEFLKFFNFFGLTLDEALRNFLKNLALAGETQERERVLAHFSRRYMETNPGNFNSEDSCHTLVCALMLLNTDLHGQNIGRKMNVSEFIENLAELNDGDNYPREVLKNLYHSIRTEPLECHFEDDLDDSESGASVPRGISQEQQRHMGYNPFLDIPDPSKATEFKKGYVMRKCCVESDGRKTALGKRGWKMFYASLRDMVLYLHKDDHAFKKNANSPNMLNAIRIHHSLAYRATDYKKKQHVFRLQTSDWAQYLFQTSNSKECQDWIDKINFVAASLSAPPLPGAVGSQRKFQRPLLTATYTTLNLREQALHHEQKVLQIEQDLHEHRKYPPEKGAKTRVIQDYVEKEAYLQFELKRFKVYSAMIQMKLATYPELEPSLVEVAIGEVDEPVSLPSSPEQPRMPLPGFEGPAVNDVKRARTPEAPAHTRVNKPVQRSVSDRPQSAVARPSAANQSPTLLPNKQILRHSSPQSSAAYETQV